MEKTGNTRAAQDEAVMAAALLLLSPVALAEAAVQARMPPRRAAATLQRLRKRGAAVCIAFPAGPRWCPLPGGTEAPRGASAVALLEQAAEAAKGTPLAIAMSRCAEAARGSTPKWRSGGVTTRSTGNAASVAAALRMAEGPLSSSELAHRAGIKPREATTALGYLRKTGAAKKASGGTGRGGARWVTTETNTNEQP